MEKAGIKFTEKQKEVLLKQDWGLDLIELKLSGVDAKKKISESREQLLDAFSEEELKVLQMVEVLAEQSVFETEELKKKNEKICVCDFTVLGCEKGEVGRYGVKYEGLLIIDHHMPHDFMKKHISSATLAMNHVQKFGALSDDYLVLVNHTDADSVLSMMMMIGLIPPDERFNQAALSGDHNGEENELGDLLQAIQNERDLLFSVRELYEFLNGNKPSERAQKLIDAREEDRVRVRGWIKEGRFKEVEGIQYIIVDTKVEMELLLPEFPDAKVVMLFVKMEDGSGRWEVKIRLGVKTTGIALNELGLPVFGGRWNGGGTKRRGGTDIEPEDYVRLLVEKISRS
ncbi:hypothetical protein ACFL0V_04550 [Nanoarchaeota archaeon]